jgi:hypothetical protein
MHCSEYTEFDKAMFFIFIFFSLPHFSCDNDIGIIHQKRERSYGFGIIMIKGHGCSLH